MKFLSFSILAAALLSLASCSKQTDTKVSDSQTNNNNNSNSSFNWEGTAPMSAKVDGVPWLAETITFQEFAGSYYFSGKAADGSSINPVVSVGVVPGLIYSMPSPAGMSWQNTSSGPNPILLGANPGKVKIVTNNSTTLEGYFWGEMKDLTGMRDTVVHITEGYFKIDKP